MKKVVIIGAGIAGLTCGIYAQKYGFETQIYEMHSIAGGECTAWKRGDYTFDGCIHWLVGSKPGTSLNGIWRETGAIDDSVQIVDHEIFSRYEDGEDYVNLYTDADRLEKHLIEIAPEDKARIRKLCRAIRKTKGFAMPVDKPMDMMTAGDGLRFAASNIWMLPLLNKYTNMTMSEYTRQFRNPLLKRALIASIPDFYPALALIATLSGMHEGDGGYPLGGSRAFAMRMEDTYRKLGGKLFLKTKVDSVVVENGVAKGIALGDGRVVPADHVISCADGYHTFEHLLRGRFTPDVYRNLFSHPKQYPTSTCALVFLGINAKVPYLCRSTEIRRSEPVTIGGTDIDTVQLLHYGYDSTLAPQGKTVLACFYQADYDHWNELYADKERYRAEKKKLEEDAVASVIKRYPGAEGNIEATDVVTPMTYVRYCNAWRGSWMTWGRGTREIPQYFPGVLPGLEHFTMAGIWTMPPGGLPSAGAAGKFAAQRLCIQYGVQSNG